MPELLRNAVRCLQCRDVIESRHSHDYVTCSCGNIAVDGGPSYDRLSGRGLDDASYEPLHVYLDGQLAAGRQFIPFLEGVVWWGRGDGLALNRLFAALMTGTTPAPDQLSVAGQRRLGYLAEIALTMSPEPWAEKKLLALVVDLQERLRSEPVQGEAMAQLWLPSQIAGPDSRATEWGLAIGICERLRRAFNKRID